MAKHNNLNELFIAIADAIRSKTGSTDPIVADDFPDAISSISSAGGTGSTDTGCRCYYYEDGGTGRYERIDTNLGSAYKVSDDVLGPEDYNKVLVLRTPRPGEVATGYICTDQEVVVNDEYPGLTIFGALVSTGDPSVLEQLGFPSAGTWLVRMMLNEMSTCFYIILNKVD